MSTKRNERCNEKLITAESMIQNGIIVTKSAEDEIKKRAAMIPGLNVSESDVSVTADNIIGRICYQSGGTPIVFYVSLNPREDENGYMVLNIHAYAR